MTAMTEKRRDSQMLIVAVFIYAFLLAAYLMSNSMLPETALFPRMIIVLFAVLNTLLVIQSFRGGRGAQVSLRDIGMPLLYFIGIVLYALLFSATNYFVATAVMLVSYMLVLKVRPLWIIPAVTIAYGGFVYLLFVVWLKTSIV